MASLFATLHAVGVGFSVFVSPSQLASVVQAATHERYTSGLSFPTYYNVANAMILAYSIVVATQLTLRRRLDVALLPPLGIFIAANLIITTRAPLVFMVLMMVFASLYTRKALTREGLAPKMSVARILRVTVLACVFVVCVFYGFELLRYGVGNTRSSSQVWLGIRKWPLGGVPAFSEWYDAGRPKFVANPPGYYTFMGIYDLTGIAPRQVGTFADYTYLTSTESTNVYTIFRGMIADYGRVGTIFVMILIGFVGNAASRQRLFSYRAGLAIFVAVYTYLAFSPFSSYWAYTSNIIAVLLVAPLMKVVCTKDAARGRSVVLARHA